MSQHEEAERHRSVRTWSWVAAIAGIVVLVAGFALAAYLPAGREMIWASVPFALAPVVMIPALMISPDQGRAMLKLILTMEVVLSLASIGFLAVPMH